MFLSSLCTSDIRRFFSERRGRQGRDHDGTRDGIVTMLEISLKKLDAGFAFVVFAESVTERECVEHLLGFEVGLA